MLLNSDGYSPMHTDIWSVGCVFLEMSLGPTMFGELWMPAYKMEILQDPPKFEKKVGHTFEY